MSPEAQAVERNLRAAMRCYAFATPQGETRELPGLTLASSGIDFAVFNSAMLTAPVGVEAGELDRRIQLARVHFDARGLGWSFWLCTDYLDGMMRKACRQTFGMHGMVNVAEPPGLYLRTLRPPGSKLPALEFRPVDGERERMDFIELAAIIFSLPYNISRMIYGPASTWESGMDGWVGYVDGRAVSVVTTVSAAGVAGVYSLGTLPQYQGRGYGQAILRYGLECARRKYGVDASVLQTTNSGMSLYKKLGYRKVAGFAVHVLESCGQRR